MAWEVAERVEVCLFDEHGTEQRIGLTQRTAEVFHARLPDVVVGLASAALVAVADEVADPGRFGLASDGIFYCVVVLAPSSVGWLIATHNRQVAGLRVRRRALEGQRGLAVRVARAEERDRVVRRLGHGLTDRLTQMVADVRSAEQLACDDPHRVPERLSQVEDAARDALAELRDVLGTLRTSAPVDTPTACAWDDPVADP